jgi:hypothetical protein
MEFKQRDRDGVVLNNLETVVHDNSRTPEEKAQLFVNAFAPLVAHDWIRVCERATERSPRGAALATRAVLNASTFADYQAAVCEIWLEIDKNRGHTDIWKEVVDRVQSLTRVQFRKGFLFNKIICEILAYASTAFAIQGVTLPSPQAEQQVHMTLPSPQAKQNMQNVDQEMSSSSSSLSINSCSTLSSSSSSSTSSSKKSSTDCFTCNKSGWIYCKQCGCTDPHQGDPDCPFCRGNGGMPCKCGSSYE